MGTTASNQHLAGIDLSQTGSNLGSSEGGSHQPEEKELSAGDKAAQPELSGRDDPLLDELREQCYDHRAELNFLTGLSLPYGPYVQIWLGPSGTELAPLFPNAEVWPPDWLNSKNDHQEFTASSISLVTANYYAALTLYQDGTIEHCCLDQFYKQGSFELYYPSLPYLTWRPRMGRLSRICSSNQVYFTKTCRADLLSSLMKMACAWLWAATS